MRVQIRKPTPWDMTTRILHSFSHDGSNLGARTMRHTQNHATTIQITMARTKVHTQKAQKTMVNKYRWPKIVVMMCEGPKEREL